MTQVNLTAPAELEILFGDPASATSAFTHAAIVEADGERRLVPEAERLLDEWGFGAELVPEALGGRWLSTENLVRRLLPIFRRDPALGLGHGITTFMAAVNIWASGDAKMQDSVARDLLAGERIAVCFHELSHGNDLLSNECAAEPVTQPAKGWSVSGSKAVINNIARAQSVLLFTRTGPDAGARSFSLLLWRKSSASSGDADTTRRILTAGMRGCQIGAVDFDRLILPEDALVGVEGGGAVTALKAFQVTRAVIPALATATVDAAIRLAVPYMRERELYGATVWDLSHARMLLARAWSALVVGDAMARAVVRTLHVQPDEGFMASAASKFLVPMLLNDAMQDLSILFGSSFYTAAGSYGIVEKWLRDLVVVPIGHAGSTSCLLSLIPNLPSWARRMTRDPGYEARLFSTAVDLEALNFDSLSLGAGRVDSLTAPLRSTDVVAAFRQANPALVPLLQRWQSELHEVREGASELSLSDLGADASPEAFEFAERLAACMAAGALIGSWHEGRFESTSPFYDGSTAIEASLIRLSELLPPNPEDVLTSQPTWTQDLADTAAAHVARVVDGAQCLGAEELTVA